MRLTPLEVRKQTFARRRIGGVDPEHVQDFLNVVATELEDLLREQALLRERLDAANQKINEFRSLEETLRKTLVKAEGVTKETEEAAKKQGEHILQQANLRAERVLADARNRLRQITAEIAELSKKKDVFLNRFSSLVRNQLELLSQHQPDYDELSGIAEDAEDALLRHDGPAEVDEGSPSEERHVGSRDTN